MTPPTTQYFHSLRSILTERYAASARCWSALMSVAVRVRGRALMHGSQRARCRQTPSGAFSMNPLHAWHLSHLAGPEVRAGRSQVLVIQLGATPRGREDAAGRSTNVNGL